MIFYLRCQKCTSIYTIPVPIQTGSEVHVNVSLLYSRAHAACIYAMPTASNEEPVPQLKYSRTLSMFNSGSNSKLACVSLAALSEAVEVQSPLKTLLCLPDVVQLNISLLVMLASVKEGPVSDGDVLVEPGASDPGGIWYCLSHFSSLHD